MGLEERDVHVVIVWCWSKAQQQKQGAWTWGSREMLRLLKIAKPRAEDGVSYAPRRPQT